MDNIFKNIGKNYVILSNRSLNKNNLFSSITILIKNILLKQEYNVINEIKLLLKRLLTRLFSIRLLLADT